MGFAGRHALVLLAASLLTACAGNGGGSERALTTAAVRKAERVGAAGVTVALPPGWHEATPSDGPVIDPVTRLVVASAPIRPKGRACQIAAYEFAPTAVAIVVVEWRTLHRESLDRASELSSRKIDVRPPPAIECFEGRGGSVQFVERERLFGAYLLVGRRAPERAVEQAQQLVDGIDVAPRRQGRLSRNGISISVPRGWDGRMLYRDPGGSSGVIYQVANFDLPPNEGFEPPVELEPGQEDPIKAMGEGDVLVMVVADAPTGRPSRLPLTLAALEAVHGPRVPVGHRLLAGAFCFGRRCLDVSVDFGGEMHAALERAVDDVLASIAVEPEGR